MNPSTPQTRPQAPGTVPVPTFIEPIHRHTSIPLQNPMAAVLTTEAIVRVLVPTLPTRIMALLTNEILFGCEVAYWALLKTVVWG